MRRTIGFAVALLCALAAMGTGRAHAVGYLVPTNRSIEPLAIRYHRVNVSVRERVAETRVEQTFRNHTGQRLEATYIFPVPEGASVSGFSMWVNGRRQQGELLESGAAREVYERIVARMRDPGLVEHMGGNLFRARVFPIEPNSEQRVEIRFHQTLEYQGSVVHYRYPLRTTGRAAQTLEDFTLSADIVSRTPIRAVYSPTHPIAVSRPDENRATVGFEQTQAVLDEDFDLYYSVQDRDVGLSLLTHRPPGQDGYFLALVAPRAEVTEREIAAKEVLFVFDTSGSMSGDKIRRAQAALDYMLTRLNPQDRFQVVRFSTDVEPLFSGNASVPASPQNVARARQFGRRFVAAGGTAIDGALREALGTQSAGSTMPRLVVFLTDGMPTVGETDLGRIQQQVQQRAGDARVYVFGVGDDVNTTFLDRIADRTGGVGDYFRDGAEMERRLSAFYDRIAYPLLTDLRLTFGGANVYDVYPQDLGHLYRGGQLMVIGRYRGRGGPVQLALNGRIAQSQEPQRYAYDVSFPTRETRNDFLPRVWATRKIGYLLDAIRLNGERAELRQEVVSLAQRFGIVTPYTSYLVVDEAELPPEAAAPLADARRRAAEQQRQQGGGQTVYSFEDDDVEGELVRPDGEMLSLRRQRARRERARPRRRSRSSGGGGGGGNAPSAAPAMEEPPMAMPEPEPEEAATEDFRGFRSSAGGAAPSGGDGESGRRVARRLREMREAQRAQPASVQRFVAGRTFRHVGGMWVGARYRRAMRTLRLRPGSTAWISLLRERPDLRPILALGDRVAFALDGGHAVVVDPGAPEGVSEAQVASFLADL